MTRAAAQGASLREGAGDSKAYVPIRRCHAQEIDLRAVRAVTRAAEQGREEGRRATLAESALLAERHARRARVVLSLAVATALFLGFGAGVVVGARAPREPSDAQEPAGK
jgi:hypothetical protein